MSVFRCVMNAVDEQGDPRTLVFEDGQGKSLTPHDTPAHAYAMARLDGIPVLRRDIFGAGAMSGGRSQESYDLLRLLNGDGGLDFLTGWALDGRTLDVYWSPNPDATFPSAWIPVQSITMRGHLVGPEYVEVEMVDVQQQLDRPIQEELYAGDNVGSSGLEGGPELEGKPKPLGAGRFRNVTAVPVNPAKLIYQVTGNPLEAITAVRDRGLSLTGGIAWADRTEVSAPIADRLCVAYGNGRWAVGGILGVLMTSDDGGTTWTHRSPGFGSNAIVALDYVPWLGLWIAGGENGSLRTSPDAVTWTGRTSQFGTDAVLDMAHNERMGIVVIVGEGGKISSSTNGTAWTSRSSGTSENLNCVAAGTYVIAALGHDGAGTVSTNGTTWSTTAVIGLPDECYFTGVAADAGGRMVAVGFDFREGSTNPKAVTAVSDDARTWSVRSGAFVGETEVGFQGLSAVTWSNGLWVITGHDGFLATSRDGDIFVRRTNPGSDLGSGSALVGLPAVAHGDGLFMAVGANNAVVVSEGPSEYASEADLLDDDLAPAAGTYKAYPPSGLFRVTVQPEGALTADGIQGASAAARTPARVWASLMERLGVSAGTAAGDYLSSDVTSLDAVVSGESGFHVGTQETQATELLDRAALSARAWWGRDRLGRYRIRRLVDPAGETPTIRLGGTGIPIAQEIQVIRAPLPIHRAITRYSRNHTVQGAELVFGLSPALREVLVREWLETADGDTALQTRHPLAEERVLETMLADRAGAAERAEDEMELHGVQRRVIEVTVEISAETLAVDLGTVVMVTDPRLGLSGGVHGLVVYTDPMPGERQERWGLWMAAA